MSGPKLSAELFEALKSYPETRRILIAYSGGLDSRVLLHLAAQHQSLLGVALGAVHIDHGLQDASVDWARECVQTCELHGINCQVLNAHLKPQTGQSIEALARDKRYSLFAEIMQEGDLLLLAQHADDQAETVLLQLLRGAGPEGLSAMPYSRELSKGHLIRPLLQITRADLAAYATTHQLSWIEDPSNADDRFDRNYLRKHIFPKLEERFPGYRKTFARSAGHIAELLTGRADNPELDYSHYQLPGTPILQINLLVEQLPLVQKHVLRGWIKGHGYKAPQTRQLACMLDEFFGQNSSPLAAVSTRDYQVRRYQDGLYLLEEVVEFSAFHYQWPDISKPLFIKELNMTLSQQSLLNSGIKLDAAQFCEVCSRQSGVKLRPSANQTSRSIKNLYQEYAIPPWERGGYPFIYQNDKLIAILGIAVDPAYQVHALAGDISHPQNKADSADS